MIYLVEMILYYFHLFSRLFFWLNMFDKKKEQFKQRKLTLNKN